MSNVSNTASQIAPRFPTPSLAKDVSFAALAELYQVEEHKLEGIARQFEEDPTETPEIRHLDFQTEIMDMASNARAKTFNDLCLKMMLWYWDTPEMTNTDNLTRADRVLLSILRDLNQLSDQPIGKSASAALRSAATPLVTLPELA